MYCTSKLWIGQQLDSSLNSDLTALVALGLYHHHHHRLFNGQHPYLSIWSAEAAEAAAATPRLSLCQRRVANSRTKRSFSTSKELILQREQQTVKVALLVICWLWFALLSPQNGHRHCCTVSFPIVYSIVCFSSSAFYSFWLYLWGAQLIGQFPIPNSNAGPYRNRWNDLFVPFSFSVVRSIWIWYKCNLK